MVDQEESVRKALSRIENLSKGVDASELEALAMEGLKVVHVQNGLICGRFVNPNGVSDQHGNWHVGAMITLMDNLAGFVTFTSTGLTNVVTVT